MFFCPTPALSGFNWTPKTMGSALIAWYRADQGVYSDAGVTPATNGQAVVQWNDLSGNGNHLTASGSGITLNTTGMNSSKPTVNFTGLGGLATTGAASVTFGGGTTCSAFAVASFTNTNFGAVCGFVANGQTDDFGNVGCSRLISTGSGNNWWTSLRASTELGTMLAGQGIFYRVASVYDGFNEYGTVNLVQGTVFGGGAATGTFGTTGQIRVGFDTVGNGALTGNISEIIITNPAQNPDVRSNIDLWFLNNWWLGRLGFGANRARWCQESSVVNKQIMSRYGHRAFVNIKQLQIAAPNMRISPTVHNDLADFGLGAVATVTASIEYPANTFTQVKFAGSTTGSVPDANILISDVVSMAGTGIAAGDIFWVRMFWQNANGTVYNTFQDSATYGDICNIAVSGLTDQTMSGSITNAGAFSLPTAAIIAPSNLVSIGTVGDSIVAGNSDTVEAAP